MCVRVCNGFFFFFLNACLCLKNNRKILCDGNSFSCVVVFAEGQGGCGMRFKVEFSTLGESEKLFGGRGWGWGWVVGCCSCCRGVGVYQLARKRLQLVLSH